MLRLARRGNVSLSFVLAALSLVATSSPRAQDERAPAPTRIARTVPPHGATGVAPDRPSSVLLTRAVRAGTLTARSVHVQVNGRPLDVGRELSADGTVITLRYPGMLPAGARVRITVDGDLLLDRDGIRIDADGDGVPGGVGLADFSTVLPVAPVPLEQPARIMGYVFDTAGAPLQGAVVRAWHFPRDETKPPIAVPPGISDPQGLFVYTTHDLPGREELLLEITAPGHSEALRQVAVLPGECYRVDDARLQPLAPKVPVQAATGGTLQDPTQQVTLVIPPGALQQNSNIGVTLLDSAAVLREELPDLVADEGTFIDIAGVFGEATNLPVTLRLPNRFNLPHGTRVPFGKVDHNTLLWSDLRDLYTGPPPIPDSYLGRVVNDASGNWIEIQFDKFCSICTGYCLPYPRPGGANGSGGGDGGESWDNAGRSRGNSVVVLREGSLREAVALPSLREFGGDFGVALAYSSTVAAPSVSLAARVDYNSTRPVERTLFRFSVEGLGLEAAYDRSSNNQKPAGTLFWNGRNGLGQRLPTGSYSYSIDITSLNAATRVSIPASFGGAATQSFSGTYPGLARLRAAPIQGRIVLIDRSDSPYGAGWSLVGESRLSFGVDGSILAVFGNADWRRYVPDPSTPGRWISPAGDTSTLTYRPGPVEFVRTFADGGQQVFDGSGRVRQNLDRYGLRTTFDWIAGQLVAITSPTGRRFTFGYDGAGKLSRMDDSTGRTTRFQVDARGDLVAITDVVGATRTFAYDGDHRLIAQTGARGERTEYSYQNGRVVEARSYDTGGTTLLRRRQFAPSALAGEAGAATAGGQGTIGNPIGLVDGRTDAVTDGRGFTYLRRTNDQAQTEFAQDALGQSVSYAYDTERRLVSRTRPNGSWTKYDHDTKGNVTQIQEYSNATTVYSTANIEYNGPFDAVSRIVDAQGKQVQYAYDPLGNLTTVTDHDGRQTRLFYQDPRFPQLPTRVERPTGDVVTFAYDGHGNLVTLADYPDPVTNPTGRPTTLAYDAVGNLLSVTDARGARTRYTWDALGRMTSVEDPLLRTTSFAYDEVGCGCSTPNLTRVTLPGGGVLRWQYDGLNRMVARTDQRGKTATFTYDAEGNLVGYTNRAGQTVAYSYDAISQLVRKELPGNEALTFEYDAMGNLTAAADDRCRLRFAYDFLQRVSQVETFLDLDLGGGISLPLVHDLDFTYDKVGNRLSMKDSFGIVDQTLAYDNLHRLRTLTLANFAGASLTFGYDDTGRRTSLTRTPSGVVTSYGHDRTGQLTALSHATNPPIALTLSPYDAAGNLLQKTQQTGVSVATQDFVYDPVSHLTGTTHSQVFGDLRVPAGYTYDPADRLTADNEYTYRYDDEGRLEQRVQIGSTLTDDYVYDADDRLRLHTQTVDVAGTPAVVLTVRYDYDPFGRRIQKTVNGVARRFLYDHDDLLAELDAQNRLERSYTYGPRLDEPLHLYDAIGDRSLWYHTDDLGSVLALSDSSGAIVQSHVFDEYGALVAPTGPLFAQPFGFTARERDLETGLMYYRARQYDPRTGRFLALDPLGLHASLNFYGYVGNNPVNFADPSGMGDDDWWDVRYWDWLVNPTTANFSAGMGDTLSFGITNKVRDVVGGNDVVNQCSGAYTAGMWTGVAVSTIGGGAAGWSRAGANAGRKGYEFSHWIPNRFGGPRSLWNGNYVSKIEHALSDPFRYRFMPRVWKASNPLPNMLIQQWNRLPYWLVGSGAGLGYGLGGAWMAR